MKFIEAKSVSYGGTRPLKNVKFIVIHYTSNKCDTAENNGKYFATGNKESAGAHIFIGQDGDKVKSVPLKRIAWSVGGSKYPGTKGGKYHGICTNANSVSIELCDNATKDPSQNQIMAVREAIKYIRKYCPNAKTVIRHYDVTGKLCPIRMVDELKWEKFLHSIGE